MITVFVGDTEEYLSVEAKKHDLQARLFCSKDDVNQAQTFYTSLGDCGLENLLFLFEKSQAIYYCPPNQWSDGAKSGQPYSMQYHTEKLLDFFQTCKDKKIFGFKKNLYSVQPVEHDFLDLADQRKTNLPQLWIAGCSISHGVGVNKDQRYGQLVANNLDLEVSWLTHTGSSIQWARDQILRSDIQKDDIVCWGITSTMRFSYYREKLMHVISRFYEDNKWLNDIISIEKLDDDDQLYQCVTAIHQVQNFCNKVGAKLYMLDMFPQNYNKIKKYCTNLDNFDIALGEDDFTIDYGSDQSHPGPMQHMMYAQYFLRMINK